MEVRIQQADQRNPTIPHKEVGLGVVFSKF